MLFIYIFQGNIVLDDARPSEIDTVHIGTVPHVLLPSSSAVVVRYGRMLERSGRNP